MPHPSYRCPNCHAQLPDANQATLACSHCQERYVILHGIPQFIARRFLDPFKQTEQHFHDELSCAATAAGVAARDSTFHLHFKQPMMNLSPGSTVLEVAGGTRADGIEIALAGQFVTMLDLAPQAVERARQLAQDAGVRERMRFCVADSEHLPFADRSFDATFVAASFHHFPNQLAALQEMKRVTKPGGYVIWGVEPAAWPYTTVFKILGPLKRFIRRRRIRAFNSIADDTTSGFTKSQIKELFNRAGLQVQTIKPVKFLTEFYDSCVRMLGKLARRNFVPIASIDHHLSKVDALLERLPLVTKLYWHWNVISRVPRA